MDELGFLPWSLIYYGCRKQYFLFLHIGSV